MKVIMAIRGSNRKLTIGSQQSTALTRQDQADLKAATRIAAIGKGREVRRAGAEEVSLVMKVRIPMEAGVTGTMLIILDIKLEPI